MRGAGVVLPRSGSDADTQQERIQTEHHLQSGHRQLQVRNIETYDGRESEGSAVRVEDV